MVSIRGRILTGTVVSTKMHRTLIIRREYLHYVPKYARYEKRHKNLAAHVSPCFRVEEGDQVTVGQCRPLSKTVCRRNLDFRSSLEMEPRIEMLTLSGRSASTSSVCCPEPARLSRSSANFKWISGGIYGVLRVFVFAQPVGRSQGNTAFTRHCVL